MNSFGPARKGRELHELDERGRGGGEDGVDAYLAEARYSSLHWPMAWRKVVRVASNQKGSPEM